MLWRTPDLVVDATWMLDDLMSALAALWYIILRLLPAWVLTLQVHVLDGLRRPRSFVKTMPRCC